MSGERSCKACRRAIAVTSGGKLRAHACPHGKVCVPSFKARMGGAKREPCETCRVLGDRQLRLPF